MTTIGYHSINMKFTVDYVSSNKLCLVSYFNLIIFIIWDLQGDVLNIVYHTHSRKF